MYSCTPSTSTGHIMSTRTTRRLNTSSKGSTIQLHHLLILFHTLTFNALAIAAIGQDGTLKAYAEEEEKKRIMLGSLGGGCLGSAPKSTTWCTHHPRDSCTNVRNSSGAITRSTSRSSRPQSGHDCSLHLSSSHASTMGKPAILSETAARSSRATHHKLQHP
jgi:hypothetical protein